jgi:hypothetical protein
VNIDDNQIGTARRREPLPAPLSLVVALPNLKGDALGPTLGAFAEGVFDGLVREVILVTPHRDRMLADIVEETGARLVQGQGSVGQLLHTGVKATVGEWSLSMPMGTVLQPGWSVAARNHLQKRPGQRAAFMLSGSGGFRAAVATRLFAAPMQVQPVLAPKHGTPPRKVEGLLPAATRAAA